VVAIGDFAQQLVGLDEIVAALQQPADLVAGDLDLSGREHRLHFLEILSPVASAARVDEFPALVPDFAQSNFLCRPADRRTRLARRSS
jgi:hypothetical protein